MNLLISDEILKSTQLSPKKIQQELAMLLWEKNSISLEQAVELAELTLAEFKQLLLDNASRRATRKTWDIMKRDCMTCPPEDLVHIDWSKEWKD
jgi:predicted HTH domain antitoxin